MKVWGADGTKRSVFQISCHCLQTVTDNKKCHFFFFQFQICNCQPCMSNRPEHTASTFSLSFSTCFIICQQQVLEIHFTRYGPYTSRGLSGLNKLIIFQGQTPPVAQKQERDTLATGQYQSHTLWGAKSRGQGLQPIRAIWTEVTKSH